MRKEWEDRSSKLGNSYVVADHAGRMSEDTLRRARSLYDSLFAGASSKVADAGPKPRSDTFQKRPFTKGGDQGGSKKHRADPSAKKCFKCGDKGHMMKDCPQRK